MGRKCGRPGSGILNWPENSNLEGAYLELEKAQRPVDCLDEEDHCLVFFVCVWFFLGLMRREELAAVTDIPLHPKVTHNVTADHGYILSGYLSMILVSSSLLE